MQEMMRSLCRPHRDHRRRQTHLQTRLFVWSVSNTHRFMQFYRVAIAACARGAAEESVLQNVRCAMDPSKMSSVFSCHDVQSNQHYRYGVLKGARRDGPLRLGRLTTLSGPRAREDRSEKRTLGNFRETSEDEGGIVEIWQNLRKRTPRKFNAP